MESEAILSILQMAQRNEFIIVGSEILELEIGRMQNEAKKQKVLALYQTALLRVAYTEQIRARAEVICQSSKIRTFDSLHIASAEAAGAALLLTTDDKLERMAANLVLGLRVTNPLKFALEVI